MIERGTLLAFSSSTYTATARYAGSISTVVTAVPVSRAIASSEMVVNRRVAVLLFAEGDPSDAMVVGVH